MKKNNEVIFDWLLRKGGGMKKDQPAKTKISKFKLWHLRGRFFKALYNNIPLQQSWFYKRQLGGFYKKNLLRVTFFSNSKKVKLVN